MRIISVFYVNDFTYLEYYVCIRWDEDSTPRVITGTSVLVKEIEYIGMSVGIVGQEDTVVVSGIGLNSGDQVLFAKDFCTSPVHNGPFTVKNLQGVLYFEPKWEMAAERPLTLCYQFKGSNKFVMISRFTRYVIDIEEMQPTVTRRAFEETATIATNVVPNNSTLYVASSCQEDDKELLDMSNTNTMFRFTHSFNNTGSYEICLSTDEEHFVTLSQFFVVDVETLSVDRWVAGLPLPSSLVSSIYVSGYLVDGSKVKFVVSSCDEETEEFPLREDLSLDALVPFPTAGLYKLCLVSPGTPRKFLYSQLTVNVLTMTVTSEPATIDQFINNKRTVTVNVEVSAEDLVPIDVFLATSSSCETELDALVSSTTILETAALTFEFEHGYDHDVFMCYSYANETAQLTGTVLHLYSVYFDPIVWRPFYGLGYNVTGVEIHTPYRENVMVRWIARTETCEDVVSGDVLSSMKVVTFRKEGELVACVAFRQQGVYESVPYYDHHVVMYNKVSVEIDADRRLVANKQFVMTLTSNQYDLIDKVWWRNEAGDMTEKKSLFDGKAPFVIPSAGVWWVVVQYKGEEPADYKDDSSMKRNVSTLTQLDVLYWIKGMNITEEEAVKTTNLEVRGEYLEDGDLLALSPCDQACDSSALAPYTYTVSSSGNSFFATSPVVTDNLQTENCVCFSFGEDNWMKYENLILNIPTEDTVFSTATKAYMLPVSSLYRRLEEDVLTRVDVELRGHVGLLQNSYAYVVRTTEECSMTTSSQPSQYNETMNDQYGSARVSLTYQVVGTPDSTYKLCYKIGDRLW